MAAAGVALRLWRVIATADTVYEIAKKIYEEYSGQTVLPHQGTDFTRQLEKAGFKPALPVKNVTEADVERIVDALPLSPAEKARVIEELREGQKNQAVETNNNNSGSVNDRVDVYISQKNALERLHSQWVRTNMEPSFYNFVTLMHNAVKLGREVDPTLLNRILTELTE